MLALSAAYVVSQLRYPASPLRRLCFAAAMVVLLLALASPVQTIATHYLVLAHFLQNVALAEWAPALVVLGIAPAAAAVIGRARIVRLVARPAVALPLWLIVYAVWHIPVVYDAALRNQGWLLPIEHASYFAAGLVLWWPVFQREPRALGSGAKSLYLFGAFVLASPLGLLMALLPTPIYSFYEQAPRIWGIGPLRDQQLAGMLMSVAEAVLFFAVFCVFFARFLAEEDRDEARTSATR